MTNVTIKLADEITISSRGVEFPFETKTLSAEMWATAAALGMSESIRNAASGAAKTAFSQAHPNLSGDEVDAAWAKDGKEWTKANERAIQKVTLEDMRASLEAKQKGDWSIRQTLGFDPDVRGILVNILKRQSGTKTVNEMKAAEVTERVKDLWEACDEAKQEEIREAAATARKVREDAKKALEALQVEIDI